MATEIDIVKHKVPATIEGLSKYVLIGQKAIQAYDIKLKALDKIPEAKDLRDRTLKEGQFVSRKVLEAEAKLGELLSAIEHRGGSSTGGTSHPLPDGIDKKFSHYAQELHRNPDLIEKAIDNAQEHQTLATRHDVLKMVRNQKIEAKIESQKEEIKKGLLSPTGLFDHIVIDPPWPYGTEYDDESRRVASPYPEMSLEDIKDIKLPTKDNCILWLWTTHRFIWDAKTIMDYWGFKYVGILIWNKELLGIGRWLRMQCEFCLVGIKGNPLWDAKDITDIISEKRTSHSTKPEAFYKMIDSKFVGSKLDYFGRKEREGWSIYGTKEP